MRSVMLAVVAAIKRKKIYSAVIVSCLFLASLLSITTLAMVISIQKPFDRFFDEMKSSHLLLFSESNLNQLDSIRNWFEHQNEIESFTPDIPYTLVDKPILFKGREIDMMVQLAEHHPIHLVQDKIHKLEGNLQLHPELGEIWITDNMSKNYNISIGDTLSIPITNGQLPLTVSAVIIDPHYASGLFNPTRAWVAPGGLSYYLPISELKTSFSGLRLKSVDQIGKVSKKFNEKWLFDGKVLQYGQFKMAYLSFFNMLKMVLIIFSIIAFFGAFLIIFLTLNRSISSNRRMIGNFKVLGFSPKNIRDYYTIQYLVLLVFAILPATFFAGKILNLTLAAIGGPIVLENSSSNDVVFAALITFTLFMFVLVIIAITGSYKISKEKPVKLIDGGISKQYADFKLLRKRLLNSNIPLSVFLGVNWIFSNLRRSSYTGIAILITIFILVFSINVSNSFGKLKDNKEAWGIDNTDVLLKLNQEIAIPIQKEQLLTYMKANKGVNSVIPYSYLNALLPTDNDVDSKDIQGKVYFEEIGMTGLTNLTGNHPVQSDEISLCMLSARELNKSVGDSVTLIIEGQPKTYLLSGIYQDINNLGRGFRVRGRAIILLNPLYTPGFYSIKLGEGVNKDRFKSQLANDFGETLIVETNLEDRKAIQGVISSMQASLAIFSVFFISVMILFLLNDILSHINENRRSFGIFKSIGFSPKMIGRAMMVRIISLTLLCIMVGIPLSIFLVPVLVNNITQGIGLQEFPYVGSVLGNCLVAIGMLTITMLSNVIITGSIVNINSKDLLSN